jgi:hypothetical protein
LENLQLHGLRHNARPVFPGRVKLRASAPLGTSVLGHLLQVFTTTQHRIQPCKH